MTRTPPLLGLLAAALVLLAGCGADQLSGEPEVPEGWQTVRAPGVSVAVPGDWRVERNTSDPAEVTIDATGPGEERLAPTASVVAERPPAAGVDALLDVRESADEELPGAKVEEPRDVELEGAERAVRWTTTYKAPAGPGRVEGLAAEREDGSAVFVRALALDSSDVDVAAIADSVRLGG